MGPMKSHFPGLSTDFLGCLDKDNNYHGITSDTSLPSVNSQKECHEKCIGSSDCVAFTFSGPKYCYLYSKGPYTHGNGVSGSTCYVVHGII